MTGTVDFKLSDQFSYTYNATKKIPRSLAYTVTIPTWIEAPTSLNYGYTGVDLTTTGKQAGWRSDYTQIIANAFQDWNRIRNCPDSTGQHFINAFAMGYEEVRAYWRQHQRNLWLNTADRLQAWKVYRMDMPSYIDLDKYDDRQLLVNAGFRNESVVRYNLPTDWTDMWSYSSGNVRHYTGDGVVGGGCIKMDVPVGQRGYIGQTQDLLIPSGEILTFSAWYKNFEKPTYSGACDPELKVSIAYEDDRLETFTKPLRQGTSGQWAREWVTFTGATDVGRVTVGIEVDNTGDSNGRTYYFDALKLEVGMRPTDWTPSTIDPPEWMKRENEFYSPPFRVERWGKAIPHTGIISGYEATGVLQVKNPIHYISDPDAMLDRALPPTRISWVGNSTGVTSIGVTNKIYGVITTSIDQPTEKGWVISDGYRFGTYMWPNLADTGEYYQIAEPNLDKKTVRVQSATNQFDLFHRYSMPMSNLQQTGGNNYNLVLSAMTIRDDKIWAFGEESWTGETHKVLKLVSPKADYGRNYLELIRDYRLEGLTGTITSAGFIEQDPPRILLTLTGDSLQYSGAIVNLYYDYFTFDPTNRQIYTRDPYTGTNEQVVII